MEAIILGNPYDIVLGAITPVDIPAYEAEKAVVQLTDGYNPYLIGGTITTGDSYWFRYSTGLLRPITSTDSVIIGGTTLADTEKLRVVGKINTTSLQLGSTVTISSILDEDNMVSDSNTAVPTQQSVKAYVDNQIGGYLQSGDNISLLTNDSGYIVTETDPIFTASASYGITSGNITNWNSAYSWGNHALIGYITVELDPVFTASPSYNITSTQISHWDSAYGWGDHALVGYITTETDPVFVASVAYTIDSTDITNWGTAYTNNHTHSNKVLLDSLISSGAGTQALFNDGTYKTVLTSVSGSDTQIIYNNAGAYAGSSLMTFDGTTTSIDTLIVPTLLEIGNSSTTITKDSSGNLTFYDAVVGSSYTLASIVGTATNFWTPNGNNIWYGYKVGIGGMGTFNESLEVTGNIVADNFNSSYLRYNSNGNLLLGPLAGDQDTTSNKLYIHNNNSTTPLIYGNFTTLDVTLGGHLTIRDSKKLKFGSLGTVNIYHAFDGSDYSLYFQDAFNSVALTLSDLRSADYYALVSSFTDYAAAISITSANKTVWNRASYITIIGDGSKYLADDGTYKTISSGVTPVSDILYWNSSTSKYTPYSTQTSGCFDSSSTDPVNTTRLNYDGNFHATRVLGVAGGSTYGVYGASSTSTGVYGISNSGIGTTGISSSGYGMFASSSSGMGIYASSTQGIGGYLIQSGLPTANVINPVVNIIRQHTTGTSYNITGDIISITDNPLTSGTISGKVLTATIGTTERVILNPRVTDSASALAYLFDTNSALSTSGASLIRVSNNGNTRFLVDYSGKVTAYNGFYAYSSSTTNSEYGLNFLIYTNSSTVKTQFDPNVADSASAIGYLFDTISTLSTSGSKLASWKNNGSEKIYFGYDGKISANSSTLSSSTTFPLSVYSSSSTYYSSISGYNGAFIASRASASQTGTLDMPIFDVQNIASGTADISGDMLRITDNPTSSGTKTYSTIKATIASNTKLDFNIRVADVTTAVAYMFDTNNTLSSTGAKIFSIKNNTTEKVSIDKDGVIEITAVGQGIILASPDGTRYKITVANGGTLAVTAV